MTSAHQTHESGLTAQGPPPCPPPRGGGLRMGFGLTEGPLVLVLALPRAGIARQDLAGVVEVFELSIGGEVCRAKESPPLGLPAEVAGRARQRAAESPQAAAIDTS